MSLSSIAFALFIFSSLTAVSSILRVVNIAEENELEQFLCRNNNPLEQDTHVVLSTSVTHYISSNASLCVINTTYSLTLTTDSSSLAVIQCHQTNNLSHWPTTGFVFIRVHSLTLQKFNITGCGAFLKNSAIIDIINFTDSSVYFTQYQSAVLLFLHINNLLIEKITISTYYGFAVLAINPVNATLNQVYINGSQSYKFYFSLGRGILLLFTDDVITIKFSQHAVTVNETEIFGNLESTSVIDCFTNLLYIPEDCKHLPLVNAAGLTVLYAQKSFTSNVTILNAKLSGNYGSIAGAMLVLHYGTNKGRTVIYNSNFVGGNAITSNAIGKKGCDEYGASLALVMINIQQSSHALIVEKSAFKNQKSGLLQAPCAGAVFIGLINPTSSTNITVTFNNSKFTQNNISTTGACLYSETYYFNENQYRALNIVMHNITANKNTQTEFFGKSSRSGIFTVVNAATLVIGGVSNFHDNYGSVFNVINTKIKLSGSLTFTGNGAKSGAAFNIIGYSHFHLDEGLCASFINNAAQTIGGAIYAYDDNSNQCIFKAHEVTTMTFINNTAGQSGSSIYSNNMYECVEYGKARTQNQSMVFYNSTFSFVSFSLLNHISTPSFRLHYCKNISPFLSESDRQHMPHYFKPIYPGQKIVIPLYAKDLYTNKTVYAMVSLAIAQQGRRGGKSSWQVMTDDVNHVLYESQSYSLIHATLLKRHDIPNPTDAVLAVSSNSIDSSTFSIKLRLSDCPLGFELNTSSGSCVCAQFLINIGIGSGDCQISSKANNAMSTIQRPHMEWLGLMNVSRRIKSLSAISAARTCYVFCKQAMKKNVFVVSNTNVAIADYHSPSKSISLCLDNREGPLCSQCSPGYSVVFGSNECKQCSNWWLLILIVHAVTGPLFIYVLYALRLTLTAGTLNGIIFCLQMLQVIDLPLSRYDEMSILTRSFLYIVLYYPHCFFNGMTEIWKSFFAIIYPLYLIIILLFIIVLSRFSVRISNRISSSSIQVLVTVVHLSFSRLLTSVLDVFTPIDIYTNTSDVLHVWFRDAALEYCTGRHLALMIITLVIVGPILGVYMTVLLAGRPLMRINYRIREYLRPVYEAIHAPYKQNKEFFFVFRLLIILMIYSLYITLRGGDIYKGYAIVSPILTTYTALEGLCRPFKRMSLNIFNFILVSSISLFYGTFWYFEHFNSAHSNREEGIVIILTILYSFLTICLIGVIILHLLWVTGLLDKLKKKRWTHLYIWSKQNEENTPRVDMSGSFFEPYDRVREPLLSSYHNQYN